MDLEQKTRHNLYTHRDIQKWQQAGFLNASDVRKLGFSPGIKTLEGAADEYRQSWNVSPKEAEARECRLNTIVSILHPDTPVRSLTYGSGLSLITELKGRGYKIATIQKYIQDLKRLVNLQIANNTIEYNPFSALKAGRIPQAEKIKHVTLTDEQITEVIAKAEGSVLLGGWLKIVLLFAFGSGIRRKELQSARWEKINWEERSLTVEGKSGTLRKVGLGQRLYYELLKRQKEEGPILPRFAPWSISRAFRHHLMYCGHQMRLHDARHTYTTLFQQIEGVKPIQAMGRTGHQDMRMLSHYSHPQFGEVFEDKFGFMGIPEGKDAES